jgi:hypothetical protein
MSHAELGLGAPGEDILPRAMAKIPLVWSVVIFAIGLWKRFQKWRPAPKWPFDVNDGVF